MATTRQRFRWPRPGVCRVCGCVDERACPGGCSWVDRSHTVCSSCGGGDGDLAYTIGLIQRIYRRPMTYAARLTLIKNEMRDTLARYSARLVGQEHG